MEIGPLEIAFIIVVLFFVAFAFRLFAGDRNLAADNKKNELENTDGQPATGMGQVKKAGLVLLALGAVVFAFGMSTFELVTKMFLWAFVLVGGGLLLLFLSRNR